MEVRLFANRDEADQALPVGKPKLARFEHQEFCLVRFENQIYAFENHCPHMGEKLHLGTVNYLSEIVCPLHTYRFRMKTGEEASHRCRPLRTYRVDCRDDGLFVQLP